MPFLHYSASPIFKQNVFYVNGPFGCCIMSYCCCCFFASCGMFFFFMSKNNKWASAFSFTLTICFKTQESTLGKRCERFGLCRHVTGYSIDANCSPQKQNIIKNYAVSHQKLKIESPAIVFWLVTAVIFKYLGTEIHPTSFSNKEKPSYKTSEKRLPLASSKMCFISNQQAAESIINHQSRFIIQTIKRNDSLKTAWIGFWTTTLHMVNLIIFNCLEAIVVGRFSIRSPTQLKHAHVGVTQK